MTGKKGIVIVCNLDTRGEDIVFVRQLIRDRGHEAILLDFSMEEPPPFPGDIRTEEVAARGGLTIEAVREKYRSDRDAATRNQIRGAAAIVDDLLPQGRGHRIIGTRGGPRAPAVPCLGPNPGPAAGGRRGPPPSPAASSGTG